MENENALKIGAAYIRVSTDDQLEYSPDSQLKEIEKYAHEHNIVLSNAFVFMEDEGRSGRNTTKRPEFQRMIAVAKTKPKPFDVILLWKFSRFARNREDSVVFKSMLRKKCEIDVISVSEPIGDGKMSPLLEAIIECMDEYYSVNLSGEVLRGMAEKASRGEVVGSAAFGYRVENGNFIIEPREAEIVRMIFNKFVNTEIGYRGLADMLNSMGICTPKGNPMENRTIKRMIENPVYIGKIRWSKSGKFDRKYVYDADIIVVDGHHEPIISVELFESALAKAEELRKRFPKYSRIDTTARFMLQSLVRCSSCGATLVHSRGGLQCHNYSRGACTVSHYISMNNIESRTIDLMESMFESGDIPLSFRQPSASENSDLLGVQLQRAQLKLDRIRAAYENGIDTIEEYGRNKQKILESIQTLKKQIAPEKPNHEDVKRIFLERNAKALLVLRDPSVSDVEKNELLRTFVDKITFDRAQNKIQIFFYA